jgi:hypothetical protein
MQANFASTITARRGNPVVAAVATVALAFGFAWVGLAVAEAVIHVVFPVMIGTYSVFYVIAVVYVIGTVLVGFVGRALGGSFGGSTIIAFIVMIAASPARAFFGTVGLGLFGH